ncbi:MAG: hypothetical protein AB7V26_10010 [Lysobacterales bacterium]
MSAANPSIGASPGSAGRAEHQLGNAFAVDRGNGRMAGLGDLLIGLGGD